MVRAATEYHGKVDAVILTIRMDEDAAVKARLGPLEQVVGHATYQVGRIHGRVRDWTIAVHRISAQANCDAQQSATMAIQDLDPRLLALVGIAGAVPSHDCSLGDVMVATSIADLRVRALNPDHGQVFDTRTSPMNRSLVDRLSNLSPLQGWSSPDSIRMPQPDVSLTPDKFTGDDKWSEKVHKSLLVNFGDGPREPRWITGQIASQDALLKDPDVLRRWRQSARKIEAVEMEAAGVCLAATRNDAQYPVLVVRGISDVVGYDRDEAWTKYACNTAAAFAIALFASGQLDDIHPLRTHHSEPAPENRDKNKASAGPTRAFLSYMNDQHGPQALSLAHRLRADGAIVPRVLLLAADLMRVHPLRLDEECRAIEGAIRNSGAERQLWLRSCRAVHPDDLLQALHEENPSVLHFSGDGSGDRGLSFHGDDDSIASASTEALEHVISVAGASVKLAVLNACYISAQADALVHHVPCVIGISHLLGDRSIVYVAALYRALAFGNSVAHAHQIGLAALKLDAPSVTTLDARLTKASRVARPELLVRSGVDANDIYITGSLVSPFSGSICEITLATNSVVLDNDVLEQLAVTLRHVVGEPAVEIMHVDSGGRHRVRLMVYLSRNAAQRLIQGNASGQLTQICDYRITQIYEWDPPLPACRRDMTVSVPANSLNAGTLRLAYCIGQGGPRTQFAEWLESKNLEIRLLGATRTTGP